MEEPPAKRTKAALAQSFFAMSVVVFFVVKFVFFFGAAF